MNEMTEKTESSPAPESLPESESIEVDEEKIYTPQNELPFPEQIDLNAVFPEEENDLNDLFPDEETRQLLKKVQRNKKDLHTMTDRFAEEDWSGGDDAKAEPNEEDPVNEPTEPSPEQAK
jgi:hypothetical protein